MLLCVYVCVFICVCLQHHSSVLGGNKDENQDHEKKGKGLGDRKRRGLGDRKRRGLGDKKWRIWNKDRHNFTVVDCRHGDPSMAILFIGTPEAWLYKTAPLRLRLLVYIWPPPSLPPPFPSPLQADNVAFPILWLWAGTHTLTNKHTHAHTHTPTETHTHIYTGWVVIKARTATSSSYKQHPPLSLQLCFNSCCISLGFCFPPFITPLQIGRASCRERV